MVPDFCILVRSYRNKNKQIKKIYIIFWKIFVTTIVPLNYGTWFWYSCTFVSELEWKDLKNISYFLKNSSYQKDALSQYGTVINFVFLLVPIETKRKRFIFVPYVRAYICRNIWTWIFTTYLKYLFLKIEVCHTYVRISRTYVCIVQANSRIHNYIE